MALELSQLVSCIEGGDGRGVDTLDQRFQDTASLIEQADYAGAAAKCQETFGEGQGDVRLIAWFSFGLFLQEGLAVLPDLLSTLERVYGDRWTGVGPERKKENHATAGMAWLFGKIGDRVSGDEPDKLVEANRLRGQATLEQATGAIGALDRLGQTFTASVPLDPARVMDAMRPVRDWLDRVQAELTPPPEPEAAPDPEPHSGAPPAATQAGPAVSFGGGPLIEASFRMVELQARLAAFEALIQRNELAKAALVASDITRVIEHFDPRLYLPRLFSGFFSQLARRSTELFSFQQKKDSPAWRVVEQLYRTDLDAFVRFSDADFQAVLASAPASAGNGGGNGNGGNDGGFQPDYQQPPQPEPQPAAPRPASDDGW